MTGPTRRTIIAGLGGGLGGGASGGAALLARPALAGGPAMLPSSAMRDDIAVLRRAYETLHPGLLRYATAGEVAERFDRLSALAARPMTLPAFYLALSRFLATIRCGHSYANFYNQAKPVQAALFDAPGRLPLAFVWIGRAMVVTADPLATGIVPGSRVLAINGVAAADVLAALMTVARADGHNDDKRRRLMSVQGEDRYESFDVFHPLLFGAADRFSLAIEEPGGRRRTAVVAAATLAQRRAGQAIPDAGRDDGPVWSMERRGDVAVLTMNGWGLYNSKWDWRGWLDAEVDRLIADRVPRLVVDLRRNEGGEDCGDALVARMTDRRIVTDPARRLVRYRTLPAELRPYCDTWDRSFDRLGETARVFDDRFLELAGTDRDATVIEPRGRRYTGAMDVLIGPQNSSATFAFAQMVRRERLGRLAGETTGGNRRGINGGCFYFLRLPSTGLEADLPLIGTFPRAPQPDAGIVPDLHLPRTAASIAAGRDDVMTRLLAT